MRLRLTENKYKELVEDGYLEPNAECCKIADHICEGFVRSIVGETIP